MEWGWTGCSTGPQSQKTQPAPSIPLCVAVNWSRLTGGDGCGGGDGGDGGGFFLACEDFGRMFDNSFPACALFRVHISSRTLIPLFMP